MSFTFVVSETTPIENQSLSFVGVGIFTFIGFIDLDHFLIDFVNIYVDSKPF